MRKAVWITAAFIGLTLSVSPAAHGGRRLTRKELRRQQTEVFRPGQRIADKHIAFAEPPRILRHNGRKIVRANEEDIPTLAKTLAAAFAKDALPNFLVKPGPWKRQRFEIEYELLLRIGMTHGLVYTTENRDAATIWIPPGGFKFTDRQWKLTEETWKAISGGGRRYAAWNRFLEGIHKTAPKEQDDGYYLFVIGARPDRQGRGLGRALMQPMLEHAHRTGFPVFLETQAKSNIDFYEKLGGQLINKMERQTSGELTAPPVWFFRFDPLGS